VANGQSSGRDERGRLQPDVSPALGQDGARSAPEPPKRPADDEWRAFAGEDPAFFIKLSETAKVAGAIRRISGRSRTAGI
jgi:hypothetical protein